MATIVSIINLKGGVGKSTMSMILAEYLYFQHKKRVLVVDLDPQYNLTQALVKPESIEGLRSSRKSVYHLFQNALNGGHPEIPDYVARPPLIVSNISRWGNASGLDMIISLPDLAQLDEEVIDKWQRRERAPERLHYCLRDALNPITDDYDYILIDCPPSLSILTSAAIVASDYFVTPVIPEPLSMLGIQLVLDRIGALKQRFGDLTIQFSGTVLNKVLHYRNTHRIIGPWLAGEHVGNIPPVSPSTFNVFHWWIPDSERIRKITEYQNEALHDELGLDKFTGLMTKYDGGSRLQNPAASMWFSRSEEEGTSYRLWERLDKVVMEFRERTLSM